MFRRASDYRVVQEVPPGAILDFDNPDIGIVADFTHQPRLDVGVARRRFAAKDDREDAARRMRFVEHRLRRRTEQHRRAVQFADPYEAVVFFR